MRALSCFISIFFLPLMSFADTVCVVTNSNGVYYGHGINEQQATSDAYDVCFSKRDGRQDLCSLLYSSVSCSDDASGPSQPVICGILTRSGSYTGSGATQDLATADAEKLCIKRGGDTFFCTHPMSINCP